MAVRRRCYTRAACPKHTPEDDTYDLRIGFFVLAYIIQLDMTWPHEVFAGLPASEIHII